MESSKSEKVDEQHIFCDRSNRFALDCLLRRNGFRIRIRKKGHEPVWERDGKLITQSKAVKKLNKDDVLDAKYLEDIGE